MTTESKNRSTTDLLTGPLYAAAGVTDIAVAELRKLPKRAGELQKRSQEIAEKTRNSVKPDEVRGQLAKQLEEAQSRATKAYDELVARGHKVVESIRNQKATQELVNRVESTARSAKATATTVRRGAQRAQTSAKATTTSAKKTAAAAGKAVQDGADKVG